MNKYTLTQRDFGVFTIEGLEARMKELITCTRPKLENLGEVFTPFLTELTGDTHFAHVAKHARRTKNPPKDTWVAFSTNNRGYKMLPHFQIGLFKDHAFVQYGIIYEAPEKSTISKIWRQQLTDIKSLDVDYFITLDHMNPEKILIEDIDENTIEKGLNRLESVKKGEFLIGKIYYPGDNELKTDANFLEDVKETLKTLSKFYIYKK